jgi:hypothetical protein
VNRLAVIVALVTTLHNPALAAQCSWGDMSPANAKELVPEFYNYAEAVVQGRVLSVSARYGTETARIGVLRWFKGKVVSSQIEIRQTTLCPPHFTLGEERIFFIKGDAVSSAGARDSSAWLLAALTSLGTAAVTYPEKKPPSDIHVRNASRTKFLGVVVGGRSYGNIAPGESTNYQSWDTAYRYSSVWLMAESQERTLRVIDYVGESPLGPGRFTYVLTYNNGRLGIDVERDSE